MVIEVYTGSRPGRPQALAVLCALTLAGTLGLAWAQVHAARALGPQQRVGDLPLLVRLPKDWQQDPRDPTRFLLPTRDADRRKLFGFERGIRFEFERLPGYEPLEDSLRRLELDDRSALATLRAARIGGHAGVEVRRVSPQVIGRAVVKRETVIRFASLPRGEMIMVTYDALIELRPADLAIIDDVCDSLVIDDPTITGDSADFLAQAGFELDLDAGWQVVGADFPGVPAVYIGGTVQGAPAWSLGVYRSWLAAERTGRDLLIDLAADSWLLLDDAEQVIADEQRDDGATVTTALRPQGVAGTRLCGAMVVTQSARRVALIVVFAGPEGVEPGLAAARRVAETIKMTTVDAIPPIADAERAGVELMERLHESGPQSRWGAQSVETTYREGGGREILVATRAVAARGAGRGYEGVALKKVGRRQESTSWRIDAGAEAYAWEAEFFIGHTPAQVSEQRGRDGAVTRRLVLDTSRRSPARSMTFTPGPGFVPLPAESIIAGWAAGGLPEAAIVECSSALGQGAHTQLLHRLAADGEYPRVLVQRDYWPVGRIEAYDEERATLHYELRPSKEYRRVR